MYKSTEGGTFVKTGVSTSIVEELKTIDDSVEKQPLLEGRIGFSKEVIKLAEELNLNKTDVNRVLESLVAYVGKRVCEGISVNLGQHIVLEVRQNGFKVYNDMRITYGALINWVSKEVDVTYFTVKSILDGFLGKLEKAIVNNERYGLANLVSTKPNTRKPYANVVAQSVLKGLAKTHDYSIKVRLSQGLTCRSITA